MSEPVKQDAPKKPPRKKKTPLFILAFASLLFALGGAEVIVRLFFAAEVNTKETAKWAVDLTRPSSNAELIYENRPNMEMNITQYGYRVVTDADGARIDPKQKPVASPDIKIALLGDSSSFGWWVNFEQTYASLMRRMLEKRTGKSIALRNYSVPGYNSHHSRVTLRDRVLSWEPDLIILHYDHNDADPINDRPAWLMPPEYGDNVLHSALYKFVVRRVKQSRNQRFLSVATEDPNNPEKIYRGYRHAGPQFERHLKELKMMARLAKRHNVPIVAFLFNTWLERHDKPGQDPFFTLLHDPVSKQLRSMGFEVIDTYASSQELMRKRQWKDMRETWLAPNDGHPNPAGHRFLANVLYSGLINRKGLKEMFPESAKVATPLSENR